VVVIVAGSATAMKRRMSGSTHPPLLRTGLCGITKSVPSEVAGNTCSSM
jgi:hypothetical protein